MNSGSIALPGPSRPHAKSQPNNNSQGGNVFLKSLPGYKGSAKRPSTDLEEQSRTKRFAIDEKSANKSDDQIRIITGTVELVKQWRKLFPKISALWEIYATVLRIQDGVAGEKLILLRKSDGGPVMQVFYYEIDFKLQPDIVSGTPVRCVGRFVGTGCRFHLYKIRSLQDDETAYEEMVARLSALSNFSLAKGAQPSKLASVL